MKEKETREERIKEADVILAVFDLHEEATLENVIEYWIPYVQSLQADHTTPIILVGNKLDKLPSLSRLSLSMEEKIASLLQMVCISLEQHVTSLVFTRLGMTEL